MKKIFVSIVVVLFLIVGILIIISRTNMRNNIDATVKAIYIKYLTDVDGGVNYFMNSLEFENMNKNVQIEKMGNLLKLYENGGMITNLYYDESSKTYTFLYGKGNIEGALGTVSLKERHPMLN